MTDEFSELSDEELSAAIYDLTDAESDLSEKVARSVERKNLPEGIGGAVTRKIRSMQYTRHRIQHEETSAALVRALAEQQHRLAVKQDLPALSAELEKVEALTRERNTLAERMQSHLEEMAATALAMEKTEDSLRRLETSIENREGGFRGVVRIGGTSFHPELLAKTFKTSAAMAFKSSSTYGRICRVQGLHSPNESQRSFATAIQQNGSRLLEKFRQEIDRIKTRKVA